MREIRLPKIVEQGRQSLVGANMPTQCAMHLPPQKLSEPTTIGDHKNLQNRVKVVIIHQMSNLNLKKKKPESLICFTGVILV